MPDSQRSRKQWRKARHAETCVCVPTHSSTAIHLTTAAEIPTQSTHLPQKNRKEISPLRKGPFSQFCPPDQKKQKTKNPRQANTSFKAGRAMLFSLQRQDLLFWSLRQKGHVAAPHQYCYELLCSSFVWAYAFISLGDIPGKELLDNTIMLCLSIWGITKAAAPFYTLPINVCGFQFLHILNNTCYFVSM